MKINRLSKFSLKSIFLTVLVEHNDEDLGLTEATTFGKYLFVFLLL